MHSSSAVISVILNEIKHRIHLGPYSAIYRECKLCQCQPNQLRVA